MNTLKNLAIVAGLLFTFTIQAQNEDRLKAQKVAFITQKLDLTPDEAAKFWPIYNQMEGELKSHRHASNNAKTPANMTDAEANEFIASSMKIKEQELQTQKKYIDKFKAAIPVSKVAQLIILERDFKKEVVENIKEKIKDRKAKIRQNRE